MTIVRSSPVLVVSLLTGLVLAAAELIGGGEAWQAAIVAATPLVFGIAVTLVSGRSDVAGALAGRPADERIEHISLEATAWAFGISAVVVVGAMAVLEASRADWLPYAFVAVVMALSYLASLLVLRVRH